MGGAAFSDKCSIPAISKVASHWAINVSRKSSLAGPSTVGTRPRWCSGRQDITPGQVAQYPDSGIVFDGLAAYPEMSFAADAVENYPTDIKRRIKSLVALDDGRPTARPFRASTTRRIGTLSNRAVQRYWHHQ